jgi:hypothetical protein
VVGQVLALAVVAMSGWWSEEGEGRGEVFLGVERWSETPGSLETREEGRSDVSKGRCEYSVAVCAEQKKKASDPRRRRSESRLASKKKKKKKGHYAFSVSQLARPLSLSPQQCLPSPPFPLFELTCRRKLRARCWPLVRALEVYFQGHTSGPPILLLPVPCFFPDLERWNAGPELCELWEMVEPLMYEGLM